MDLHFLCKIIIRFGNIDAILSQKQVSGKYLNYKVCSSHENFVNSQHVDSFVNFVMSLS